MHNEDERGVVDKRNGFAGLPANGIDAREMWAWSLVLVAVAYWANAVRAAPYTGPFALATLPERLSSIGAFNAAAWLLIATRVRHLDSSRTASPAMILAAVSIGIICLVPARQAAIASLLLAAAALSKWAPPSRSRREIVLLLVGIAGAFLWSSFYLGFVHIAGARMDAGIVAAILRTAGYAVESLGNIVTVDGAGSDLRILVACSSSIQLAEVGLAFLVVRIFRDCPLGRPDLPWLIATFVVSILLTELRLSLMALSDDCFHYWHDGVGSAIYQVAAVGAAILIPAMAPRKNSEGGLAHKAFVGAS
jgi:hypothetical protein